jgi:hypothetical protein
MSSGVRASDVVVIVLLLSRMSSGVRASDVVVIVLLLSRMQVFYVSANLPI